jgi:hypothetical protein
MEEVAGNCLVSVVNCALLELGKTEWDPVVFRSLLPETSHRHLKLVSKCLEADTGLRFDDMEVRKDRTLVRRILVDKLDGGSLCDLRVKSISWFEDPLNIQTRGLDKDDLHAIMVFGYYAPLGLKHDLWLYLADSLSEKLWFLHFNKIFGILEEGRSIRVGVFSSVRGGGRGFTWWDKLQMKGEHRSLVEKVTSARGGLIKNC